MTLFWYCRAGCSILHQIVMMKHIRVLCSELVPATPWLLLCRPRPPKFILLHAATVFSCAACSVTENWPVSCFSGRGTSHPCAWKSISEKASMIVSQARLLLHAHAEAFLHPSLLCKFTMLQAFTQAQAQRLQGYLRGRCWHMMFACLHDWLSHCFFPFLLRSIIFLTFCCQSQ